MTRVLECCVWLLLCVALVSAGDLNHLAPNAYSQQSLTNGNYYYAPSGYANSAYDDQNTYNAQGGGYQVQEIATNHVGNVAQQGHIDVSSIDLTQNSLRSGDVQSDILHGGGGGDGGISYGYDTVQHQSNAFDATQTRDADDVYNSQQAIHTPAETFPISKHVEITKNVPYPVYKQLHVPVQRPVHVQIPHPVLVPQPQAYPIHIPVAKPYAVPVVKEITIPIEKIVPYPVVKKVPYTVEKHVPYHVEKFVTVHKKVPYAIKVPIVKTIIHRVNSHRQYSGSSHGRSYAW